MFKKEGSEVHDALSDESIDLTQRTTLKNEKSVPPLREGSRSPTRGSLLLYFNSSQNNENVTPLSSSQVRLPQSPKRTRPREVPLMTFDESPEGRVATTQWLTKRQVGAGKIDSSRKWKETFSIGPIYLKKQLQDVSVTVSINTNFQKDPLFVNCFDADTVFVLSLDGKARETSNASVPNPVLLRARRQ
jgi:hypothetical protein